MKPRTLALFTAMTLFAVLGLTVQNPAQTIITFDPPGSTNTYAFGINPAGAITGTYVDASNVDHGFLRAADGTITNFDPPGSTYTSPSSINPAGAITGYYFGNRVHVFLRAADGTITTFDPPGSTITYVLSINPAGAITGYFYAASS